MGNRVTDFARDTMEALKLSERISRQEGAHQGAVNDIVRLEHAVDELRREIHGLTIEIRRGHSASTWVSIFAGAFAGSVSGLMSAVAAIMWLMAKGMLHP